MILMSTSMVLYHGSVICFKKGRRWWRRSFASNMFAIAPERKRAFCLVPCAKHKHTRKRTWWEEFFSDDADGSWFGWSAEDVLGDAYGTDRDDGEEEMSEDEKFEAWKRRAEAISELREAQEDATNAESRAWEDWLGGNGSSNVNTSSRDQEWNAGAETLNEVSDDPNETMRENGIVKAIKDSVGESDDDLLFEDRVFQYASTSSAKFIALLIIIPWTLDFLVHEYVLMPFLDRLELRDEWRLENRKAFANIWSDMVYGIALFILIYFNKSKVALLKFTGYKLLNNISDTGKAFLIILVTDIFLGYHSESGWQALVEIILEHYGLEVDQAAITIFICSFPVVIDACVKLWLFKILPKLSPNVANIFREMQRH
ncbi:protein DAY-LENGTH-DEPENDENT DELAYED-GREENING 1, chloroplastic isoform X3 [Elaeis guineensis]|uniref:protein DAY-LENGTH-DEPENDENT DELAYED-GREENING 1, chloroplastic isoform X3 n=1 Tax=Elaeis guineensis var. tenera TaxID=51953 RepID=UPI00057A392F